MRLVPRLASGLLAVVLLAPLARADETTVAGPPAASAPATSEAPRSKIALRVVRVMPESRQALLFDRTRATHVLAEIGAKLDGYTVEDIDDDSVTLVRDGREIILVAPAAPERATDRDASRPRSAEHASPGGPAARSADGTAPERSSDGVAPAAPVDPYGEPAVRAAASATPAAAPPSAPAGSDSGIRVVRAPGAPIAPGEGGIRVVAAPTAPSGSGDAMRAPTAAASPSSAAQAGSPGAPASPVRAVSAAGIQPASGRSDQATLDARALADVLADGRPARGARAADVANAPTRPPEVRVTSAASGGGSPRSVSLRDDAAAGGGRAADRGETIVIPRGEVGRALADFAALSAGIRASFSASGVTIDSVGDGTIFQRAGLRAGDVVTSVDGQRLRSLDDAANLYARASAIKAVTVQIVRAGQPATLRVVIQ